MYRIIGYLVKYKYKKRKQNIDKWFYGFMNTDTLYLFLM